ncbi:MAG TPA: thiamine phosphate synthase [bacterium]|nr:thiamine phosphate synthase [bacterium]
MLWMITDFSKYGTVEEAIDHISMCLRSGVAKVTLRNTQIYSGNLICEIKDALDARFPDKEIFIHDPSVEEIKRFRHLHFPSKRIDEAINVRKDHPEKTIALSTHHGTEYEKAFDNGINYALLSPVFKPLSKFNDSRKTVLPINLKNLYLLGGIDRMKALLLIEKGFCNLAGISLFYGDNAEDDIVELSLKIKEKK